jgi:hypothetical protein
MVDLWGGWKDGMGELAVGTLLPGGASAAFSIEKKINILGTYRNFYVGFAFNIEK